jgi:S-formylglutathione hydrolase FrmB
LRRQVTYSVILPESGSGPYPVLMQLLGYGGNHTDWLHLSRLIVHAAPYPLIVVLPDGGTSAYLNLDLDLKPSSSLGLQRYEDFLMDDLPEHVAKSFRVRPGRWAIGGLSMGGFGAMRLGLKHPDRFASIWAHSGAYYTRAEMVGYYPDPDDADVFAYAHRLARSDQRLVITFDCGIDDDLVESSRRLHSHMEAIGLHHRYFELPGSHNWEFWDGQTPAALAQHVRALDIG